MQSADKCLLPLRRKISPATILNLENHTTENGEGNGEIKEVVGKRERLFSASSRSVSSVSTSKYNSSLAPPFTPPVNNCETQGNVAHGFHWRRPSEHFLEVLEAENKVDKTQLKTSPSHSLPPLRKTNQREDLPKALLGETKIAFEGSVCKGGYFRPAESSDGQLLLPSGSKKEFITPVSTNGKILRKTNSLPLIRTCSALTNGLTELNITCPRYRTKSAIFRRETTANETEHTENSCKAFDENLEDTNDETFDDDLVEQDTEKFSMICHWLKECEKAKVT